MGNAIRKRTDWRAQAPGIARHEGVWEGSYRYYDADGRQVDEHESLLVCRFLDQGLWPYWQSNHYRWADGRRQTREFPALVQDGRLVWQGGLIEGWAASLELDQFGRTTMLYWERPDQPGVYLYEMIQLSDCDRYRSRVWHWFRDGRLFKRTLVDEQRVSADWSGWPVPSGTPATVTA